MLAGGDGVYGHGVTDQSMSSCETDTGTVNSGNYDSLSPDLVGKGLGDLKALCVDAELWVGSGRHDE